MRSLGSHADITVIGGGMAGTCAAIAAARLGRTVNLINNRPMLGGNASSEIRVWVCGATAQGGQKFARETGIMGELWLENLYRNPDGNPYYWDQVVLDAVRAEPHITLWLNTDVRDVEMSADPDPRIASVVGWQMGAETLIRFESPVFIDATGDALVGFLSGAEFRLGREPRDEFDEEWAPDAADDDSLGSTMLLYTKDVGHPVKFVPPSIAVDITTTPIAAHRPISLEANGCAYWWIEYGGQLDVVHDNERIRDELWGVVYGIWDHIKNSGRFDADNYTLEWAGSVPGKREYRRLVGDYVLNQNDIMGQTEFDDAVAFGGWSIDLHAPGGVYHAGAPAKNLFGYGTYDIPYRSLFSRNVPNLMMAGRDISASHVAFGSIRVMATCAIVGEAAGTGAALAVERSLTPREVGEEALLDLRRTLLRQDASLLGAIWDDPRDLALAATATASTTVWTLTYHDEDEVPYSLTGGDVAIVLPADPAVAGLSLLLDSAGSADVRVELWETAGGQNYLPVDRVASAVVAVEGGRRWVPLPLEHTPGRPCNVELVVRSADGVSLVTGRSRGAYGVLGLVERVPRVLRPDGLPQANSWDADPLRRRGIHLRVAQPTEAYSPAKVIGGYQRPYDGPQMWASEPMAEGREEWVRLDWRAPQQIGRVDAIFNDDVDEHLNNLHRDPKPFDVFPELVRDYRLEACRGGDWQTIVEVEGNHHRHRVHSLVEPLEVDALRLVVVRTNGSPSAHIASIRVFPPDDEA
jgi:hypothetical protein